MLGGCGRRKVGLGGYQPGVYMPLKALFLVALIHRLWVLVRTAAAPR